MSAAEIGQAYLGWRQAAKAEGHALLTYGVKSDDFRVASAKSKAAHEAWLQVVVAVEGAV